MNTQIIDLTDNLWTETLSKLRHDFYHLPEYVNLEAKRTQAITEAVLITDNEKIIFLPYLRRHCNDLFKDRVEVFDVVSPYGYPGFLLNEAAANTPEFLNLGIEHLIQAWRNKQICSAFLRLHPLLNTDVNLLVKNDWCIVNGETISIDLKLEESDLWHQTRASHRYSINKCKREGFVPKMVPIRTYINDFNAIYEETMNRINANKSYYFGENYFNEIIDALGEKIHLCIVELNGEITCGGLFTEYSGIVQYYLSGTKTSFLKQAPSKLMIDYVRFWAKERGNKVLHLGGGVGSMKDSLYDFKAGFSKEKHTFLTLRIITDEEKYFHLVDLRAKHLNVAVESLVNTNFFPAYRSNG